MRIESTISQALEILGNPVVLAGLVIGSLLLGLGAYYLSPRRGWRRTPAVLAALGAALAFAVTLSKGTPGSGHAGVELCSVETINLLMALSGGEGLLNILLLMPFAFCAVLATGRPLPVLAVSILMSAGIEVTQTLSGLGVCTTDDLLANSLGAIVAVFLGRWIGRNHEPRGSRLRYARSLGDAGGD